MINHRQIKTKKQTTCTQCIRLKHIVRSNEIRKPIGKMEIENNNEIT